MNISRILLYALILRSGLFSIVYSQPGWLKDALYSARNETVHKDAAAIVLHHTNDLDISKSSDAIFKIRIAYKILNSEGKRFGILSEPIYPFRKVKNLKGWLIRRDNSTKTLTKENIVQMSTRESVGYYDDSHLLLATFPTVEPEEVVAFEYTVNEKGWTSLYQSFEFQRQQPVKFARFSVKIPQNWKLKKAEWQTEDIQYEEFEGRYIWTANNLPYQVEEPLTPSWYYLAQRVAIICFDPDYKDDKHFSDWSSVTKWFATPYQNAAQPDAKIVAETRKLTQNLITFEEKLQTITAFSRDDIRYVAVEIGKGRWKPRAASTTLFNRFGDCKDKTTLMRAMLQVVDIHSVPVFISTNFPVNPNLPTPFQFNHCIIAISLKGEDVSPRLQNASINRWLFFDPTHPSTEIDEMPIMLQGRNMLVITQEDSLLVRLPYPSPRDYRRVYRAKTYLNQNGSISAKVRITDFGGRATQSRYHRRIVQKK